MAGGAAGLLAPPKLKGDEAGAGALAAGAELVAADAGAAPNEKDGAALDVAAGEAAGVLLCAPKPEKRPPPPDAGAGADVPPNEKAGAELVAGALDAAALLLFWPKENKPPPPPPPAAGVELVAAGLPKENGAGVPAGVVEPCAAEAG